MPVPCERVGLEYFETAPVRFTTTQTVAATPEEIFAVFVDARSWTRWVFAITEVEWTSPFPLEVGSTRTVHMRGGITAYEEFIAWEPGRRMAFRFNEISKPAAKAFGEDYQVTDLGDGTCRLNWMMAMTPSRAGRYTIPLIKPFMGLAVRRTLVSLRKHVESHPELEATD